MYQDISLKENVQHGTVKNPINGLHFTAGEGTLYPEHFFVERHWHHYIELHYIVSGSYQFEINFQNHVLQEGDICILNTGDLHQITGNSPEAVHDVVLFDPCILEFSYEDEMQERCLHPLTEQTLLFPNLYRRGEEYHALISPIVQELVQTTLKKEAGWYFESKIRILELIAKLYKAGGMVPSESAASCAEGRKVQYYKLVVTYMEENYSRPVTLQELAELIPCSSQYLCRLFKEIAGVSPIQYLIGLRLKKACDLLEHSSKSVLEIALDCGFENISYFIRKFKEVKGCTPKEYRSKTAVHLQKKECYNMERKNTV